MFQMLSVINVGIVLDFVCVLWRHIASATESDSASIQGKHFTKLIIHCDGAKQTNRPKSRQKYPIDFAMLIFTLNSF